MRLIDADALIKHLKEEIDECGKEDIGARPIAYGTILGLKSGIAFAEAMPTVDIKAEVAREILNEIANDVSSKIPMTIRPIYKNDLDFDAGLKNGKADALIEVLKLIAKLENKYTKEGVGE